MSDAGRIALFRRRLMQQLWWRPALWSVAAIAAAAGSALADRWIPAAWLPDVDYAVVDELLRIMASSMLAVSTFALSVLVGAYASAANAGTPRATQLVVAEPRSQKAVAVFLAAFIFSIVGLIAIGAGRYGPGGRLVLFGCALAVLAWVIVAFMSYIDVISRIGRVSHTIETVERAAGRALNAFMRQPLAGALVAAGPPPGARPVRAGQTGHVQFVDTPALQTLARELDGRLHVGVQTGEFVHPGTVLCWIVPARADDEDGRDNVDARVRKAFVVGPERTIEQDAAYGLIVLAEIAQRALSPGINDPGTAIAVIGSQTRLLIDALAAAAAADRDADADAEARICNRVTARAAAPESLLATAFEPIARCAHDQVEVMRQLLQHLDAVVRNAPDCWSHAARELVQRVLARAERAEADSADLVHWQQQAEALGLVAGASDERAR